MTAKRLVASLAMSGLISLAPAAALADNSSSISNTGPNSNNQTTINNDQNTNIVNAPVTNVNNVNNQNAASGPANVSGNTTGGSATTGSARNNNTTTTNIGMGGFGGGVLPGMGGSNGGTSGGGGSASGGKGNGSLALAGVGGGSLPDTGASFPIDVTALRAALTGAAGEDLAAVNRAKGLGAGLLAAAALMSLLGAAGSAAYMAKKEQSL